MPRSALIATLALLSTSARASIATAQERIVVVRAGESAGLDRERVSHEVASALGARGVAASPVAAPRDPAPPDATAIVDRSVEAYHLLRFDEAITGLESAIAMVEADTRALERAPLLRALLVLALARAAQSDDGGADAAIDRALAIDRDLPIDPAEHPPTLEARVAARRARLAEPVPVDVRLDPRDAELAVDGAEPARAGVLHLAPGRHVLRASAPRRVARTIVIEVGAEPRIDVILAPDARAILAEPGAPGAPIDPAVARAARTLGGDLLVVDASLEAGTLVLVALDGAQRVTGRGADARAAAIALAAALTAPTEVPRSEDATPWIVAGVAGGAAAAIAAVVIGVVVASQAPDGFTARGERL